MARVSKDEELRSIQQERSVNPRIRHAGEIRRTESDTRVNLIAYRNAHHMAGSGYARMSDVLGGHVITTPNRLNLFQRVIAKALLPLANRSGSQWYHRNQLIAEIQAGRHWMRGENQIFHFLYGENSYRYLGLMKKIRSNNHIVCTYHTPPEKFLTVVKNHAHLKNIDAVIVFTREQAEFFSDLIDEKRVYHVPHGVDTDYFFPINKSKNNNGFVKGLFVGQHLRDFSTLSDAVRILERKAVNFKISIVTPIDKHHYFTDLKNVDLYHAIPDQQLLELYQTSDIFALPLLKTTANCAVQEAMACGLPVVTTDLDAVHEYMDESCAFFTVPGDAEAFANAISRLCKDESLRMQMAAASRNKAMHYSLAAIASKTRQVYAEMLSRKDRG